ncbi:MAG: glycosyltransferase [Pseudomonadota bacterium]
MRVLFYNWVDYLDAERRGGGVSVYQRNLLNALSDEPGVETVFLASGISYDLTNNTPRWEQVRHGPTENAERRFEIVNSGCLSPGHHSFGHQTQIDHPPTVECFFDFIEKNGPFDIVHFNNLEGLPARVLALKDRFPNTRVIYALHNYYPLCPQVNLWFQEEQNCRDFDDGRKCTTCLAMRFDVAGVRNANAVAYNFKRLGVGPGTLRFDNLFGPSCQVYRHATRQGARFRPSLRAIAQFPDEVAAVPDDSNGLLTRMEPEYRAFGRRREAFVELMNAHCDRILCVSDRVAQVAARFGLSPAKLEVAYIGTQQAAKFAETTPRPAMPRPDGTITLAYLGYMRRDKGFYFLLDALEAMPTHMARRIKLVVCARAGDKSTMWRLRNLGGKFASVRHADGYTHDNLDRLLEDVDVGVIPVLWEDNLPQVAIEMHARHIPLITSDLGGAKELGNTASMVFEAGHIPSFHAIVSDLLSGNFDRDSYWLNAMAPVSMERHCETLLSIYRSLGERPADRAGLGGPTDDGGPEHSVVGAGGAAKVAARA